MLWLKLMNKLLEAVEVSRVIKKHYGRQASYVRLSFAIQKTSGLQKKHPVCKNKILLFQPLIKNYIGTKLCPLPFGLRS